MESKTPGRSLVGPLLDGERQSRTAVDLKASQVAVVYAVPRIPHRRLDGDNLYEDSLAR